MQSWAITNKPKAGLHCNLDYCRVLRTKTQDPEISCTVPNGVLSIQHVSFIGVDPYVVNNRKLLDWVNIIKQKYPVQFRIRERSHFPEQARSSFYNEIAEQIGEQIPTLQALARNNAYSRSLRDWAEQIFHLEWQFQRYAKYLRDGTLKPMRDGVIPNSRAQCHSPRPSHITAQGQDCY